MNATFKTHNTRKQSLKKMFLLKLGNFTHLLLTVYLHYTVLIIFLLFG